MNQSPDQQIARFPGAFTITPFRNDCLIEVLWEPTPLQAVMGGAIGPEGVGSGFPPSFIIGGSGPLAVGRIAMMPEPSEAEQRRRSSAAVDAEEVAEAVAGALAPIADVLRPLMGKPRVQVGSLVLYPAGATTPIPVEGYESTRLLPLSAIVARLDS